MQRRGFWLLTWAHSSSVVAEEHFDETPHAYKSKSGTIYLAHPPRATGRAGLNIFRERPGVEMKGKLVIYWGRSKKFLLRKYCKFFYYIPMKTLCVKIYQRWYPDFGITWCFEGSERWHQPGLSRFVVWKIWQTLVYRSHDSKQVPTKQQNLLEQKENRQTSLHCDVKYLTHWTIYF